MHRHSVTFSALILLLTLAATTGCALRVENRRGDTWVAGLSRSTLKIVEVDGDNALVQCSRQNAPLEVGLISFGVVASLGVQQETLGYLLPVSLTNTVLFPSGPAMALSTWRLGFIRLRIPREGSRTRIVLAKELGSSLRLDTADPSIRLGYSRTSLTTIPAGASVNLDVTADFSPGIPVLTVHPQ